MDFDAIPSLGLAGRLSEMAEIACFAVIFIAVPIMREFNERRRKPGGLACFNQPLIIGRGKKNKREAAFFVVAAAHLF